MQWIIQSLTLKFLHRTCIAMKFYSEVFGWKADLMPDGTYAMFSIGDTKTGGGFDSSTKSSKEKTGPGLVINVEDIPAKLADIKKAGGKIVQEKTEIAGSYGFYDRFQDTNGNHLQIYSRK